MSDMQRYGQSDTTSEQFSAFKSDICTGVDSGLVGQSVGSGLHKRRHEAQLDVMLFQKGVFVRLPHLCDVAAGKQETHIDQLTTCY